MRRKESIVTLTALISSIVICSISLAYGFPCADFTSLAIWILIFRRGLVDCCVAGMEMVYTSCFISGNGGRRIWFMVWLYPLGWFRWHVCLFAWDMSDFRQRLRLMAKDDDTRGIERRHLLRISLLAMLGLFLASITMLVNVQLLLNGKPCL